MKRVIAFEGLGQGTKGAIYSALNDIPGIEYYTYKGKPKRAPGEQLVILGHSLGGEAALLFSKSGDQVITLDPRPNNLGSWVDWLFRFQMPFKNPEGVEVLNFYRRGGMGLPGQMVVGAVNIYCHDYGHMGVPHHPAVRMNLETRMK